MLYWYDVPQNFPYVCEFKVIWFNTIIIKVNEPLEHNINKNNKSVKLDFDPGPLYKTIHNKNTGPNRYCTLMVQIPNKCANNDIAKKQLTHIEPLDNCSFILHLYVWFLHCTDYPLIDNPYHNCYIWHCVYLELTYC